MKEEVGLWIDHKKAVIVMDDGEEIITMNSNLEKHTRFYGGAYGKTAYSANYFPAEDQYDRRMNEHLNKYYTEIIERLHNAKAILVLGPGEAKQEFVKRLEQTGLRDSLLGVETADKLTDRQIAARVKKFFTDQKVTMP